jgi:PEGA domain
VAIAAIALLVNTARKRNLKTAGVQLVINTTPPGASVRVNGETKCTSNCTLSLTPGNYQITAFLDGYEAAASSLALIAGRPATLNLAMEPQAQSLRILTDLDQGKVTIDDQPPADLQEGQFIVDNIAPGMHTVKLTSRTGEASFSFEITNAKLPAVAGPITARNLAAVLVASLGNQARVITNSGPLKLALNGQPQADASPSGVDLTGFQAGVDELVVGEGKDQRSVKETFGPAPMLTAFLKSDLNIGTLIVSTGQDNVRVFLNNKEYRRRTQRGQLRIQTIGKVTVRVAKDGFTAPAPQIAEVTKGGETRLEFTLKAIPKVSMLQIRGGTAGAQVLIDQAAIGVLSAQGNFDDSSVAPGEHTIELRHDQFVTRRLQRSFKAGQTVIISGAEATLAEAKLPPQEKSVEAPVARVKAPPPPKAGTMADFSDAASWKLENGEWRHQGGGFLAYKLTPKGVFTFTVELLKGGNIFHGGRIRWCLNYIDSKNYALYEMDNKNFWAKVVENGKTLERTKTPIKGLDNDKSYTIQIDVTPEHIVHKMFSNGEWVNLDSWAETGRNFTRGKFGFLVQGNDEIGVSAFRFQPK